jgi:hypothetical protein
MIDLVMSGIWPEGTVSSVHFIVEVEEDVEANVGKDGMCRFCEELRSVVLSGQGCSGVGVHRQNLGLWTGETRPMLNSTETFTRTSPRGQRSSRGPGRAQGMRGTTKV